METKDPASEEVRGAGKMAEKPPRSPRAPPGRARRFASRLFFTLLASLLVLVPLAAIGELHFRRLAHEERPWTVLPHQTRGIDPGSWMVRSLIPGLTYVRIPTKVAGGLAYVNRWGYRDSEFDVPKPPGVFRIVVLGDSMTFGGAVEREETFSGRLAALLNRDAAPGVRFDVANLGTDGYEALQCCSTLRYRALPRLEPDLVVYSFFSNDLFDATFNHYRYGVVYGGPCFGAEPAPEALSRSRLAERVRFFLDSRSSLYAELRHRWEILRFEKAIPFARKVYRRLPRGCVRQAAGDLMAMLPYFRRTLCADDRFAATAIESMADLAVKNAVDFLMMVIPAMDFVGTDAPQFGDDFVSVLSRLDPGIAIYAPKADIRAAVERRGLTVKDLYLGPADKHPTVLGHELIAQALFERLRKMPSVKSRLR